MTQSHLPSISKETAEAKIKLDLTKAELSIQAVLDSANGLVFNEDNMPKIDETITKIKGVLKAIDTAHKSGKAAALKECDNWDDARRDLRGLLAPTLMLVDNKYTILCQSVEEKNRKNKAEEERKKKTLELVNSTVLNFSQEITAATELSQLVSIQNRINLEQAKEGAYKEFLPLLKEKIAELNPLLKSQKEALKGLQSLNEEEEAAIASGDDQKLSEILEKKETLTSTIQENKVRTEEKAINSTVYTGAGSATQIFPTVKTKRRTWKYKVPDLAALYKKYPDLVILEPNEDKICEILKEKIANGESKDKEEMDYAGLIEFFIDKKYS